MIDLAGIIDHTALKADTSKDSIKVLCEEAKTNKFKAVCVNPIHVKYCSELLKDSEVRVATVIGFPLGANTPQTKAFETKDAIAMGAHEVDMVINIGALKDGNYSLVKEDIEAVVVASENKALVKVIIETALLTDEEKRKACELAMEAGANFVKTSTGFSTGGATLDDVRLMKSIVGEKLGVKASGGVKNHQQAVAMMEAGATRIGTSSGVEIVKG
ncbi:deoxyribose-phosphate aldolase [Gudongella sp. DL1XJH-153]|uniref:deoxyribose-phosphate aldolase n=1 Tax=Gudongella sp. DL1XJH-153 TaxID=3409804 RepID=UPI003BB68973